MNCSLPFKELRTPKYLAGNQLEEKQFKIVFTLLFLKPPPQLPFKKTKINKQHDQTSYSDGGVGRQGDFDLH